MRASLSIQQTAGGLFDLHTVAVAAGYLGAIVGVVMFVPQIRRTFRNRDVLGVSALTWALTGLSCFSWLLYGLRADEPPQIPGNVLMVTGALIVVLSVPSVVAARMRALRFASVAAAIVVLAVILPAAYVGYLALVIGIVAAVPQLITSLRRRAAFESAVSVPAWLLRGFSQICWMTYAILIHDHTVLLSTTIILSSAIVLVCVELRRPHALQAEPVAPRVGVEQPARA